MAPVSVLRPITEFKRPVKYKIKYLTSSVSVLEGSTDTRIMSAKTDFCWPPKPFSQLRPVPHHPARLPTRSILSRSAARNFLASRPQHVVADANPSLPAQRPSGGAILGPALERAIAVDVHFFSALPGAYTDGAAQHQHHQRDAASAQQLRDCLQRLHHPCALPRRANRFSICGTFILPDDVSLHVHASGR